MGVWGEEEETTVAWENMNLLPFGWCNFCHPALGSEFESAATRRLQAPHGANGRSYLAFQPL